MKSQSGCADRSRANRTRRLRGADARVRSSVRGGDRRPSPAPRPPPTPGRPWWALCVRNNPEAFLGDGVFQYRRINFRDRGVDSGLGRRLFRLFSSELVGHSVWRIRSVSHRRRGVRAHEMPRARLPAANVGTATPGGARISVVFPRLPPRGPCPGGRGQQREGRVPPAPQPAAERRVATRPGSGVGAGAWWGVRKAGAGKGTGGSRPPVS